MKAVNNIQLVTQKNSQANNQTQKKIDKYKDIFNFGDIQGGSQKEIEVQQHQQQQQDKFKKNRKSEQSSNSLTGAISKQSSVTTRIVKLDDHNLEIGAIKNSSINLPALNNSNVNKISMNEKQSIPKSLLTKLSFDSLRKKKGFISTSMFSNDILKGVNQVSLQELKPLKQDSSRSNIIGRNANIQIMDMIEEDKQALKERTLMNITDISYIQKSPKAEIDFKDATNKQIQSQERQHVPLMQLIKQKNKNTFKLMLHLKNQVYEISHENAKYDSDIDSIEKKIQIDQFYKQKEQQQDNFYIQQHKDALNNLSVASNKGILHSSSLQNNSAKVLKTEEISILQNSQSTIDIKTNRVNKQYQTTQSNQRVLTEGADSSPTHRKQQFFGQVFQISNLPISRKDVKDLELWLSDMINNLLEQKDLPKQKLLDGFQVIYTACLKELIRQVKISCVERGILFEKVWIAYTDLILKGQSANEQYHSQLEKEFLNESTRIHKAYKQQIDLIEEDRNKDKQKIEEQDKEIQILSETSNYFKKKLLNADLEAKKHKKIEEDLRSQLEAVIQEKLKLKLLNSEQKKQDDPIQQSSQNQKRKTSRFIQERKSTNHQNDHEQQDHLQSEKSSNMEILNEEIQETPAYFNKIHFENEDETKEEFKNSKISVVSHLLNKKNLIFSQDDGANSEREEYDHLLEEYKNTIQKGSQQELDDLIEQEADEEKREKLKDLINMDTEEQYELKDEEIQTDDIKLSDCEQINILIHQLTNFDQIKGGDNLELIPEYEEALEVLKTGEMSLDSKMSVMNALKNALKQIHAYVKMSEALNSIAKSNIQLQDEKFDLDIKHKEKEIEIQEIRTQYKQLLMKFGEKDNQISNLEDKITTVKNLRKQENRNFKVFFKGLVQNAMQSNHQLDKEEKEGSEQNQEENQKNDNGDEDQNEEKEQVRSLKQSMKDLENQFDVNEDQEERSDSDGDDENGQNRISELLIDAIQSQETQHQLKQGSLFVGDDISKVTYLQETQQGSNLNDVISKLMGQQFQRIQEKRLTISQNSPLNKSNVQNQSPMNQSVRQRQSNDFRKKVLQQNMKMSLSPPLQSQQQQTLQSYNNQLQDAKEAKMSIEPSLNIMKSVQKRFYSPNQEQSLKIINTIQSQKGKITKPELPQNTVVKFLGNVLVELVKNENAFKIPLYTHCYDIILQKYGLKTVAEKKLYQILRSLYYYRNQSPRLQSCSLYCGITEVFDDTSYQIYIKSIKYFYELQISSICNVQDNVLIPFDKLYPFVDDFFKDKLAIIDYQDLIQKLKQIQSNPVVVNGTKENGIKFEEMIDISLQFYEKTKNQIKKHVSEIFYACDLDKNESIEFYEFDLMYRLVEADRYDKGLVQKQFSEEADMINPKTGEKALTLSKFVDICIDKDLFSKKKCSEFAEIKNPIDDIKTISDLCENWSYRFKLLKYRFLKCNQYKTHIKNIIDTLADQLTNFDEKNSQIIWLSYRLIDQESINILVDYETQQIVENLLPIKLQMLHIISTKFEEIF